MSTPNRGADTYLEDLITALHEHAAGLHADTAAVDLIARHRIWLTRAQFEPYIRTRRPHLTAAPNALIQWRKAVAALTAGHLAASTSEAAVLRIAASLGANIPIRLRQVLGGLDRANIALVTDAITHANGTNTGAAHSEGHHR
jgi:hypothetical protein